MKIRRDSDQALYDLFKNGKAIITEGLMKDSCLENVSVTPRQDRRCKEQTYLIEWAGW